MAAAQFTTPHTWLTGVGVAADGSSGLNAQLRDNMLCVGAHVLGQYTATAAVAAIDFTQIVGGYESLRLTITGRTADAADRAAVFLQFSSGTSTAPTFDTATNYATKTIASTGALVVATVSAGTTAAQFGTICAANAAANAVGAADGLITGHVQAQHHVVQALAALRAGATAGDIEHELVGSFWASTAPIRAVRILGTANLSSGTVATLYGLRTTSTST